MYYNRYSKKKKKKNEQEKQQQSLALARTHNVEEAINFLFEIKKYYGWAEPFQKKLYWIRQVITGTE